MKTRAAITIIVTSLVTLLVCAGAVQAKPKNVIFLIGDGMGPEQVKAAGIYAYGASGTLSFESFPYVGELTTYSANSSITDSAAAATAMATGFKVDNGVISMAYPGDHSELETLLEYYKSLGKSTGLVTTTYVEHATPAAFGAHEPSRDNYTQIASDYLTQTEPNILFGGCSYTSAADSYGYVEVFDRTGMQALDTDIVDRVSGQFGSGMMPYEYDGLGSLPHLSEMTATALDILDEDADGFFLMVEGGLIDKACESNSLIRMIYETIEFANAVQVAIDWAAGRSDTLILVAADHETGGLTVTANNGAGVLPSVTWASTGHTAADVPVYAWGVNAELISGVMDNTDMFEVVTTDMPVASNPSPADAATGISPVSLSLSATVNNPSGTTDPVNVEFFGRENPSFTIVVLPDTQKYVLNGAYPQIFTSQTQWIVDNAVSENIVFMTHEGDIVDTWNSTTEWGYANDSISLLDGVVPYGLAVGNHDKYENPANPMYDTVSTYFNQTFPYARYESEAWYGGHYPAAPDPNGNSNNYQLFSAGGDDYIVLHLEDYPTYEAIAWADSALKANPGRKAIITTHGYMDTGGNYTGKWGSTQYIRNLVVANDNVYFVLCGHFTGEYAKTTTVNGRLVHEMLADYQGRANGGDGWLRILRFEPDEDKVYVTTYSTWHDAYETDSGSQFTLDFPMTSCAFTAIGTNSGVVSGEDTSLAWPGLYMETQYQWYVTVADTVTPAIMAGPVWGFTTASLKASNPNPANGATGVDVDADLSWSAGVDAVSHDVYFGTDAGDLPLVSPEQAGTTYDPGTLQEGTTYYWAIDEHDSGEAVTAGDVWSFTTTLPSQPNTEDFELGYTIGQKIGAHPDWYDGGGGPTVTSGIGVGGSVGLAPANNIFTWTAHPFVWTEVNKVIIGMDFQTDGSAHFDDDRIGWMISDTSTDSSNIFGVQMDPGGSGYNIEGYWDGVSVADKTPSIVNLPALSANAWYRLRAEFTRLTDTSAAIDVELWSIDSAGNPVDQLASGSIADTSALGSDAPHSKYFNATTVWPAYKNYTTAGAPADNAYFEIVPLGPINQPPIATEDGSTTDEDAQIVINVLSNDTDPDTGDTLAVESVTQPSNGTTVNNGTDVTYTPHPNFNGIDTFTYTATDGTASSNSATVTITVNAINDAPVAENQAVSAKENTPKAITLTGTDVDEDLLTYYVVDGPANGALSGTAPEVTYTPNPGYTGPDSFTFKVNDGTVDSDIAAVSITIAANNIPLADDQAVAADEDVPLAITLTGSDADSDPLTFSVVTSPTNGTLSGTEPDLTYTPAENFNGTDSFTFTANDGFDDSAEATVTITVNALNDDPVAVEDSAATDEDTAVIIPVLVNDTDPEDDTLTLVSVTQGASGTVVDNGDGTVTYTPNENINGSDSFTYMVDDGNGGSAVGTVNVTVNPINDPPVADSKSVTTDEDTAVGITLTGSDVDGDTLIFAGVTGPSNGVLSGTAPNLTYTPNSNFNGSDSFTYRANDGTDDSPPATVTITVNAVNDDPVANDDAATTNEDTPTTIDVLGNDTDVDVDSLSVISVTQAANGSVVNNGSDVTYTPNANFFGSDSFTYMAGDGNGGSASATVNVTVNSINDPPTANDDSASTLRDVPVHIDVLSNDDDIEGSTLSVGSVTQPTNGSVVNNGTNVTYTPSPGYVGGDSFTYTANDGTANGNTATVTVTVTAPGPTTLFSDGFESGNLATGGWTSSGSVAVKEPAAYEGVYGVQIGGTASIMKSVSTVGFADIHVKYARNTKGLDSGESLTVEWSADGATWNNVIESTQDTAWAQREIALGAEAGENAAFSLRFRTNADKTNEYGSVDSVEITGATAGPDLSAPIPNPMTWATPPYATGTTSISMTASTAADASGVEYSFVCTAGGGHSSGWQDSPTYEDTGLSAGTEYTYQAKARDKSPSQNETALSGAASATTLPEDTTPPSPDPMTWSAAPHATSSTSVSMTATTASDPSGVEYYFECTAGGGNNSGWQAAPTYTDTGLTPGIEYTYQVKARDKSPNLNETTFSSPASATPLDIPPAAPTGLSATPGDTQISLDWNDNGESDLAGYNVYRSTTPGSGYVKVNGTLLSSSNYLDSGLVNGTTYYYVVAAVDTGSNQSGYSSEVSATPGSVSAVFITSIVKRPFVPAGKSVKAVAGVTISAAGTGGTVTGDWYFKGALVQTGTAGTTNASGYTEIVSPPAKASTGDVFRFVVTNVTLTGYAYDPRQNVVSEIYMTYP